MRNSITKINNLVVSFDYGGTEMLIRYLKLKKINNFYLLASDISRSLFNKKDFKFLMIKFEKINQIKLQNIYISSGYTSNIPKIVLSKFFHKNITMVLDHWSNYKERFQYRNKFYFPKVIIFPDIYSYNTFKKTFKKNYNSKLIIEKRLYKEDIIEYKKIKKNYITRPVKNSFLFIDVQTKSHYKNKILSELHELNVFNFFINKIRQNFSNYIIKIRKHPNESIDKYKKFISEDEYISYSKNKSLYADLCENNYIVGIDSMALYKSYLCKKKILFPLKKKYLSYSGLPIKSKFLSVNDIID